MKKISLLLLAFAMVLGMSQCKKNNEMIANNAVAGEEITISLRVAGDNDGSKITITPDLPGTGAAVLYVKLHTQMAIELLLPATVTM